MNRRKWVNTTAKDVVTISGSIRNDDTRTVANAVNYNAQILKDVLYRMADLESRLSQMEESEERMADQIFIRPNILLGMDEKEKLHRDIIQQMETGVVVLPPYCEIVHPTVDDVLDKIIAEIEQERKNCEEIHDQYAGRVLENVLSLISKYKGGSK